MFGYAGKLLFVDLTKKTYTVEELKAEDARNFLGGPGLGAKILYDRMPAHTPAFAPESMLGFVTGPTNGNAAFFGGRYTVVCKSPVYNGWNDANSGGMFGTRLKKSGYDAVFFTGISEEPVYLFIDEGKVEFRSAENLWGLTTMAAEAAIKEEIGDTNIGIALIGPGGEHLSYMAAIMNDTHRAAGRGGCGGVMGSKKLKALVVRGNISIDVADHEGVVEANKEAAKWSKEGPTAGIFAAWSKNGTNGDYESNMLIGDGSIRNWAGSSVEMTPEQFQALSPQVMDLKYKKKRYSCYACPMQCGAIYNVPDSKYDMSETSRPEYETAGMFGGMLMNDDPVVMNQCNFLCNEYGLDTISAGGTIAWLMEVYNNGLLSKEELDGIDLTWGNSAAILSIMEKICWDEGIGHILLNGSREAARYFDKGYECLVVASGIEIAQHDPRWSPGLARTYKYDPSPGRHVKGGLGPGYGNQPPEVKYDFSHTGPDDLASTVNQEIINAGGFCSFSGFGFPPGHVVKYLNLICGFGFDDKEAGILGRRLFAIRQSFNLREGLRRSDATLSGRIEGRPPLKEGPLEGVTIDTEMMADNFYKELGWEIDTGMIPKDVLESYGALENVIKDLYPAC